MACDKCGGRLYQRDDDKPESVVNRLRTFQAQTAELIKYYEKKNLLGRIAGEKEPGAVYRDLKKTLAPA
jgi:adenylate kinase